MSKDDPENEMATPYSDPELSRLEAVRLVVTMVLSAAMLGGLIYVATALQ